jgi:CBS-domain-containing membrane protein
LAAYDAKYWELIGLNVGDYLERLKSFSTHVHVASHVLAKMKKRSEKQILYAHPDDKLEKVITMMTTFKVHRVFMVDDKKMLVGVLSTSDVLTELIMDFNTKII